MNLQRKFLSLVFKNQQQFSLYSKRDLVPKILKNPKFTKEGIRSTKKKSYNYDLTQPHIVNPHLYYNKRDENLLRKQIKQAKQQRNEVQYENGVKPMEILLQDIQDCELISQGSSKPLNSIIEFENNYKSEVNNHQDLFAYALQNVVKNVTNYNLRDFSITVNLIEKYARQDSEMSYVLVQNFLRIINKRQYHNQQFTQKLLQVFVYTFNNICNNARRNKVNLSELQKSIQGFYEDFLASNDNLQLEIMFMTNYLKINKNVDSNFMDKLEQKVQQNMNKLNLQDLSALITTFCEHKQSNNTLLQSLVDLYCKQKSKNQEMTQHELYQFIFMSLLVSKNSVINKSHFKKIAQQVIEKNMDKLVGAKQLIQIGEGFYQLDIINSDMYAYIEKNIMNSMQSLQLRELINLINTVSVPEFNQKYSQELVDSLHFQLNRKVLGKNNLSLQQKKFLNQYLTENLSKNQTIFDSHSDISQYLEDYNLRLQV